MRAVPAMSAWTRTPGGSSRDANNPEKVNDQGFIDPEPGKAISAASSTWDVTSDGCRSTSTAIP
ncbi:MAG: hypothetical protein ACYDEY_13395 [Acidimicrobiales bacterium]